MLAPLAAMLLVACGGGQSAGGDAFDSPFPSEAELQAALEAHEPTMPRSGEEASIVRQWAFDTLSERLGLRDADVPAPFSPVTGARHTAGAHCVAAQLSRFAVENEMSPSRELIGTWREYCGSTMASTAVSLSCVDADASDAEVSALQADLAPVEPGELFGISSSRDDQWICAGLASGSAEIELDDITSVASGGTHRITGQVLGSAEEVVGAITAGEFGAAQCQADGSVALPQFALDCPLLGDSEVWVVSVQSRSAGRLLFDKNVSVAVFSEARMEREWTLQVPSLPGNSAAERLLAAANDVRARAGLGSLTLSEPQSANQHLAVDPMFDSTVDPNTRDMIALGLLAGWHVEEDINNASLFSTSAAADSNDNDLVAYLLGRPSVRLSLLGATTTVLAVGEAALSDAGARGLVVTTYSSIDTDTSVIVSAMRARLDAERVARGLSPSEPLSGPGETAMRTSARRMVSSQRGVFNELERAMQAVVDATRRGAGGQSWFLVSSVEHLPFPASWLESERLRVSFRAEIYRPSGSPWASYAIIAVTQ